MNVKCHNNTCCGILTLVSFSSGFMSATSSCDVRLQLDLFTSSSDLGLSVLRCEIQRNKR